MMEPMDSDKMNWARKTMLKVWRVNKRKHERSGFAPDQGCQIFLVAIHQNGENIPKGPQNIPAGSKMYEMSLHFFNIFYCSTLQNLPQSAFFVWKQVYVPSGNMLSVMLATYKESRRLFRSFHLCTARMPEESIFHTYFQQKVTFHGFFKENFCTNCIEHLLLEEKQFVQKM
jgi:hypothetical protein